jgi:hypothetical protein
MLYRFGIFFQQDPGPLISETGRQTPVSFMSLAFGSGSVRAWPVRALSVPDFVERYLSTTLFDGDRSQVHRASSISIRPPVSAASATF